MGIVGPNGAGKTTLIKMLKGEEAPDGGELSLGESVKLVSIEQTREGLTDANSVFEEVTGGVDEIELGTATVNSRAYVSWFGFKAGDQQKRVAALSGGERNRVQLAKLLRTGGNVLLMDEPTNDLDVDTMRSLEVRRRPPAATRNGTRNGTRHFGSTPPATPSVFTPPAYSPRAHSPRCHPPPQEALLDFAGCVVVVSHDRFFLDRLATHILAAEGDGKWVWYEGNYAEYEADRVDRWGGKDPFSADVGRYASLVEA